MTIHFHATVAPPEPGHPHKACAGCGLPASAWCSVVGTLCASCFVAAEQAAVEAERPMLVKRTVEIQGYLEPALYAYDAEEFGLTEGEHLADFLRRAKADGQTAYAVAQGLDLLSDVSLALVAVEHYSDGTRKIAHRAVWSGKP